MLKKKKPLNMKNIKRITKKVYANEILQNTRIHKNGKVQLRRGKANIVRVKNPKTKLQKIRKKHTIKSVYANETRYCKKN